MNAQRESGEMETKKNQVHLKMVKIMNFIMHILPQ